MDLVQKQVAKHQAKKLQSKLGLNGGGSNVLGNILGDSEDCGTRDVEEITHVDEAVEYYDSCPNNYPVCVHLSFIDRSILSIHAKPAVDSANVLFLAAIGAAAFNVLSHLFLVVIFPAQFWIRLLISSTALVHISAFEFIGYVIAFRGAYRSSQSYQLLYIVFCCANTVLFGLYAFSGAVIFHGWALFVLLRSTVREGWIWKFWFILTGLEALLWTFLLFFSLWVCFQFLRLQGSRASGLSTAARLNARHGNPVNSTTHPTGRVQSAGRAQKASAKERTANSGSNGAGTDQARVEEIKNRYRQTA